ncbi:helix-turn-helix domain-containing protein [Cohnella cellulosilytica]|uniref:Helix-turn-helix domain-containing protein n=1 Tax=Cohnella cellulosilytica TaxID=986710 RepID=A0ABW2FFG2_9BACL
MEVDLNVLTEQWMGNSFSVKSVVRIIKGPRELSTSYETTCPSFTFTVRGSGELRLNQHAYELLPGKVIHSNAGMRLKAWNTGDEEFECYRVLYLPEARESHKDNCMYKHYELEIGFNPQIFSTLDKMNNISHRGDIPSGFQVKVLVYDLLGKMFAAARSLRTSEHRTIVEDSVAYLHLHFQEPHSLFSLASRYQLSPKYFAEIFYKDMGISPINYLINYRMKFAEKLLLTTNASIREIGRSVGYADPYQFSKMFKKHMGVAPSEFKSSALSSSG